MVKGIKKKKAAEGECSSIFQPDMAILCLNKQNEWRDAKIIDVRPNNYYLNDRNEKNIEYYVHYEGINRRWDEWVTYERIKQWEPISAKLSRENFASCPEHEGVDDKTLEIHEESTKFKTIDNIEIGKFRCQTWYYSPFPSYFQDLDTLYICEFCLSFFKYKEELKRHSQICQYHHPMGNEIYREQDISIFEVDGERNTIYCENLCYISKLFLDHKNLTYDVEPFLFYVLTEYDQYGYHIVGYFSKEKPEPQNSCRYNLSCILVMPYAQRKGYGKFLISFSYELSKIEQRKGTPERPLSDLGFASYFSWWGCEILKFLENHTENISINDISNATYIIQQDVIDVLKRLEILIEVDQKMILRVNKQFLGKIKAVLGKPGRQIDREKIHWSPLGMANNV
ncbi:unnamed protein product [Blepharisma stoltei]|uniref:Histone acetyltransferase n=1 Tax=Blepharisma stoltei TaxID=1481888 RepID=A0AAU9JND1_9CILI|nr:unnamed protein product [Blepharisma stoltei]